MFSNFPPRLIDYKGLYYVILHMFIDKIAEDAIQYIWNFIILRAIQF